MARKFQMEDARKGRREKRRRKRVSDR